MTAPDKQQLITDEPRYVVTCFLRMVTRQRKTKWKQGTIIMASDSISWQPFWRKREAPINISDYKITEIACRRTTLREGLLIMKPQFGVLRATLGDGFIEFGIPELDVPQFVRRLMWQYGSSLKVQEDLKIRQQSAKQFGEKVIDSLNNFRVDGVVLTQNTHGKITLKHKDFRIEIEINPPEWIGMEFHWREKDKVAEFDYRVNTDLYDLSYPSNHEFAEEIEDQIVEFLKLLQEGKLLVGEKRGKRAFIIPYNDETVLIRKGRILKSAMTQTTLKSLDKAKSGGTFKPYKLQ